MPAARRWKVLITDISACYTATMKCQYFSLGLELLLPKRQNWVGITSFFYNWIVCVCVCVCVNSRRIANVLKFIL